MTRFRTVQRGTEEVHVCSTKHRAALVSILFCASLSAIRKINYENLKFPPHEHEWKGIYLSYSRWREESYNLEALEDDKQREYFSFLFIFL